MSDLTAVELKPFLPARDFALSKQFYADIGFTLKWQDETLAYIAHGNVSFLLQNFYVKELADNLMLHLLVEDIDAWHADISQRYLSQKYGSQVSPVKTQPWKMREFIISDPSGVLWRIAQNIK